MIPAANESRHCAQEEPPSRRIPAFKSDARQFGPNRLQDKHAGLPGTGGRAQTLVHTWTVDETVDRPVVSDVQAQAYTWVFHTDTRSLEAGSGA